MNTTEANQITELQKEIMSLRAQLAISKEETAGYQEMADSQFNSARKLREELRWTQQRLEQALRSHQTAKQP